MDIKELRSVAAVARLRSVSLAARQLGLSQPAVTSHIRRLENELGVQIFDRSTLPLRLTPVGEALVVEVRDVLCRVENILNRKVAVEDCAPVRIGSVHLLVQNLLLHAVREFQEKNPSTPVRIADGSPNQIVDMVKRREVELGFVPLAHVMAEDPEVDFETLLTIERVLICPLGHPLLTRSIDTLAALASYPFVLHTNRLPFSTHFLLEQEFRRRRLALRVVTEVDRLDSVKNYVAAGLGISVVPAVVIEPEDKRILGVRDLSHLLEGEVIGCLTPRNRELPHSTRVFLEALRQSLRSSGGLEPAVVHSVGGHALDGAVGKLGA